MHPRMMYKFGPYRKTTNKYSHNALKSRALTKFHYMLEQPFFSYFLKFRQYKLIFYFLIAFQLLLLQFYKKFSKIVYISHKWIFW
jgi:hypothetical protein